jgi:hypothetical protein
MRRAKSHELCGLKQSLERSRELFAFRNCVASCSRRGRRCTVKPLQPERCRPVSSAGCRANGATDGDTLSPPSGLALRAFFLDGRLQHRLNQMQQRSIADTPRYGSEKIRMRNRVEVPRELRVHHVGVTGLQRLMHLPYCILCGAARSVSVGIVGEVRLEEPNNPPVCSTSCATVA